MNLTSSETARYLDALMPLLDSVAGREVFILPPFTSLWVARHRLADACVAWGAQDVHADESGAHTGEVSASMLADLGCTYVQVGHSERRRDHAETDAIVAAKALAVQRWGMTAIVCVGEKTRLPLADVMAEVEPQLVRLRDLDLDGLVVAYEPSWAIGEGASPAELDRIGMVHAAIRQYIGATTAHGQRFRVIYGGSVDADQAPLILAQPGVDGLFVGRRALDPAEFAAIVRSGPISG